jgi:hypothetical protein
MNYLQLKLAQMRGSGRKHKAHGGAKSSFVFNACEICEAWFSG